MESVLLETMFKIPSEKSVSKVIIDEAVIRGESEPLLMYENNEAVNAAGTVATGSNAANMGSNLGTTLGSNVAPKDKQSNG
jgi:hypothetical protein